MLPIGPFRLKNRFILAPMAGVSEEPFRVIVFQMGAALCPTELISAQGLFRLTPRTLRYIRYNPAVEKPYAVQLFGGEARTMAKAACAAKQYGAQIIDINMGCPVKKVTRTGAGAALLCDLHRAGDIVRQVHQATGLPVTAKIRSGWDASHCNYLDVADALGRAGIAALAIHPRTRTQGYAGCADWRVIGALKRHVGNSFPIIGNGDVRTVSDAMRMLEETGCDYVMIGRGALGNPWLFRELSGGPKPAPEERCALVLQHFDAHLRFHRGRLAQRDEACAVRSFRSHLVWYARGLHGATPFRVEVMKLEASAAVERAIKRFFLSARFDAHAPLDIHGEVNDRAALG